MPITALSPIAGVRRTAPVLALAAAVLLAPAFNPAPAAARSAPESFADLVEPLLDTVVNVQTSVNAREEGPGGPGLGEGLPEGIPDELEDLFRDFLERRGEGGPPAPPRRENALGSGFIIDPDGYIV